MKFILLVCSLLWFSLSVFGQVGNLVWEDNFNGGILDLGKWTYETGTGVNGNAINLRFSYLKNEIGISHNSYQRKKYHHRIYRIYRI